MQVSVVVVQLRVPAAKFIAPDRAELRTGDAQFAADRAQGGAHILVKLPDFLSGRHPAQVRCSKCKSRQYGAGAKTIPAHKPFNNGLQANVLREKLPEYVFSAITAIADSAVEPNKPLEPAFDTVHGPCRDSTVEKPIRF